MTGIPPPPRWATRQCGRRRAIRCLTWCVGRLARTYCRPFSRCSASPAGLTTPSLACAMARIRGSVHLTWPCRRRRWMLSKQQANALERSCSTGRACRIKRGWRRGWRAEGSSRGAERGVGQSSRGRERSGRPLALARASTGGLGWYYVHAEGLGATLQDRSQLAGTRGSHNDPAMASYSPNCTF